LVSITDVFALLTDGRTGRCARPTASGEPGRRSP